MSSRRGREHRQHASTTGRQQARGGNVLGGAVRPTVLLLAKALLVPLASAAPASIWSRSIPYTSFGVEEEEPPKSADDPDLYLYLGIAVILVLLGGVFAGLTIALMGQDETYLQVIASSGEGSERRHAEKVLALLKKGKHWVLVTLLLSNVITNETLPIVLDRSLGGGWPAVLSSTVLIVIFGEVAPQSVCVRYGLSIGAFMSPFVLALMWVMCPVAWPTAKLLDWLLGEEHGTMYKKAGLKTLVQLHKTLGTTPGEQLMEDEVTIINSVLDLKDKPVGNIMTPMQDVFTMSADTVLDERMMDTILSQGYSRIPIYAPDNNRNFIGMLLVKILITYDPEDANRVRDFSLATLPETAPHTSCLDIINFFQEGKSHMVLVSDFPGQDRGALGVVTLEDVIEELIGEEIIDESDVFVDVHKAIRRMAPAPHQRFQKHQPHDVPVISEPEHENSQETSENEPLLGSKDGEGKSPTRKPNGSRPATFFVRRKSSITSEDGHPKIETVPVRSNTSEMREQLRHLGPSNVASKPRATKYTSVKIKPGVGTIPENQATTKGVETPREGRSRSLDLTSANIPMSPESSERERLLRSAGKDASDGAAALRAGYGTTGSPEPQRTRGMSADRMSAHEASQVAEAKALSPWDVVTSPKQEPQQPSPDTQSSPKQRQTNDSSLHVPGKLVVGGDQSAAEDGDTLGDMEGPSGMRERSKSRHTARSGSITETHVDYGGMKKVVLETTSSSSEDGEGDVKGSPVDEEYDGGRNSGSGSGGFLGLLNGDGRKKSWRGKKKDKEGDGDKSSGL